MQGSISTLLPEALTATHSRDRHRRQRPAYRVNEQRAWSCTGWQRSVKHFDLVGEAIPVQCWIADGHRHFFGDRIAIIQEGHHRVRWILGEAVFTLAPLVDELPGTQVAHDPLGPISEEQGRV